LLRLARALVAIQAGRHASVIGKATGSAKLQTKELR